MVRSESVGRLSGRFALTFSWNSSLSVFFIQFSITVLRSPFNVGDDGFGGEDRLNGQEENMAARGSKDLAISIPAVDFLKEGDDISISITTLERLVIQKSNNP